MKLIRAARFSGITALVSGIYTLLLLRPIYLQSVQLSQQQSLAEESLVLWGLGGWLWLLTIFAWMVLLTAMVHTYSPVHRISTILQSGLLLIAAALLIVGVLAGMNRFGLVAIENGDQSVATLAILQAFVDKIALTILEAGLLMGGGVTAWICIDLVVLNKLPTNWMAPGAAAGVLSLLSPLLLPESWHLVAALIAYCVWCLVLGLKGSVPAAYPDFS